MVIKLVFFALTVKNMSSGYVFLCYSSIMYKLVYFRDNLARACALEGSVHQPKRGWTFYVLQK